MLQPLLPDSDVVLVAAPFRGADMWEGGFSYIAFLCRPLLFHSNASPLLFMAWGAFGRAIYTTTLVALWIITRPTILPLFTFTTTSPNTILMLSSCLPIDIVMEMLASYGSSSLLKRKRASTLVHNHTSTTAISSKKNRTCHQLTGKHLRCFS
jgi:hypothetical protein